MTFMQARTCQSHGATPRRTRTGDVGPRDEAFRTLYHKHARALHCHVTRLVAGDRYRAEDIVQETLLRAWRRFDELDEELPSLRPWLFTVARRIVIDFHRKQTVRPTETDDAVLERIPGTDEIDSMLSSLVVWDALVSLSPPYRRVIHEIYFRGSTVATAAEALGIPPGTVKSRTWYALRALKRALQERGITGRE